MAIRPNINGSDTDDRDKSGKFVKGNKASPGRPPGSGKVAELRELLGEDLKSITAMLREKALAGDVQAARLILDKTVPSLRPVEDPVTLDVPQDSDLSGLARSFLTAAASGQLAPSQASQLIHALAATAKVIELDELERRIRALEDQHANQS